MDVRNASDRVGYLRDSFELQLGRLDLEHFHSRKGQQRDGGYQNQGQKRVILGAATLEHCLLALVVARCQRVKHAFVATSSLVLELRRDILIR